MTTVVDLDEPPLVHHSRVPDHRVTEISKRPSPVQRAVNVWNYRELLGNLVRKELKVKYKNSVLGFVWTLLNPMLYLVVFTVVFQYVLLVQVPDYAIFFLSGLLAWNFFSTAVSAGTGSIVGNSQLVQKVWFPREILPLASIGAALVHFFLQMLVLVGAMVVFQRAPNLDYFPALLVAMVILLILCAAFSISLAAVNVYLRDTQHLLELVLLAWFWLSAIVYPYAQVSTRLGPHREWWASLNPLVPIITSFQKALYNPSSPFCWYTNDTNPNSLVKTAANGVVSVRFPKYAFQLPSNLKDQAIPAVPMNHTMGWFLSHLGCVGAASVVLLFGALWLFGRLEDNMAEEIDVADNAIEVDSVTKIFKLYKEKPKSAKERVIRAGRNPYTPFHALEDVSFEVGQGETLALLGHNGSGKSTLLKLITGTMRPTSGRITTRGRMAALLELGAGFHPDLTGRENIYMNGSILGFSKGQIDSIFNDIVDFSEINAHGDNFIDQQVKHYSSGMYARLGFSVAINVDPDVLLVDEVLAVGDEAFQRKCLDKIRSFQREGRTILLVSHAADVVRQIATRAAVFDQGHLVVVGPVGESIRIFRERLIERGLHAEAHEMEPVPVAIDPETGEMPIIVAPIEIQPDAEAEVAITGVRVEYPTADAEYLLPGQPLKICIEYSATGAITDVAFAVEIFDERGNLLMSTTTDVLEQYIHAVQADGEVVFNVDHVPLLDGTFRLDFAVHSHDGGTIYAKRENQDTFAVMNPTRTQGLVQFPIKIEHFF